MTWDVIYPHRKTPWAARGIVGDAVVHGVYHPDTGRSTFTNPKEDPVLIGLSHWLTRARLVSYRPRRRATLIAFQKDRPVFIKVVSPSRAEELVRIYESVAPLVRSAGMRVPDLLSADIEKGALSFAPLAGDSLHDVWSGQQVDYAEIGRRLGAFGSLAGPESLPLRSTPNLAWWVQQVESRDPGASADFQASLLTIVGNLPALTPGGAGVIHGDLHDRNIVIGHDGIGLLDLDSAGRGDANQDLAVLSAHLELRALQRRQTPPDAAIRSLWAGYRTAVPDVDVQAAQYATATELTRLACLYRFRRRWRPLTPSLLDRSLDWSRSSVSIRNGLSKHPHALTPRSALQAVLEPGRLADELRICWDRLDWIDSRLVSAEVSRVLEREGDYTLELELAVSGDRGPGREHLLAEIAHGDLDARIRAATVQLQRRSRGQLGPIPSGLAAVPALRLIVRQPGLDRRLPILDLVHRPKRAQAVLFPYGFGKGVEVRLLGHRLGKRAMLRAVHGNRTVVIKGYKTRSELPEQTLGWAEDLNLSAPTHVAMAIPLGLLSDRRAVVWEDIGVSANHEWGEVGEPEFIQSIGAALRWLHGNELKELPVHDARSEIEVLSRSQRLLAAGRPRVAADTAAVMRRIAWNLEAMLEVPRAPVHRDAHPGQFIGGRDRLTIIDLDSLSLGEPAMDLGNYAAYLRIAGVPGDEVSLHDGYGSTPSIMERSRTWRQASLFRLGAQLALTTDRVDLGIRVLADLA